MQAATGPVERPRWRVGQVGRLDPSLTRARTGTARAGLWGIMERPVPTSELNVSGLARLDGRIVLVRSRRDRRNPPSAMRGTIEVRPGVSNAEPEVRLALEFPQMFTTTAHHRTLVLGRDEVTRLLASEHNGTFELEIDELQ